jgi:hypothetical protein
VFEDEVFDDPLIAILSGLIRWRMDMADGNGYGYACPFLGTGYKCRSISFKKHKDHFKQHPKNVKIYPKVLGIF